MPAAIVPARARNFIAKSDARAQPVLLDDLLDIPLDLRTRRIPIAPVGIKLGGAAIEMGWYIAAAPGIGVVAPCAAWTRRLFENDKVLDAGLPQPAGHHNSGDAGSDDSYLYHGVSTSPKFGIGTGSEWSTRGGGSPIWA